MAIITAWRSSALCVVMTQKLINSSNKRANNDVKRSAHLAAAKYGVLGINKLARWRVSST